MKALFYLLLLLNIGFGVWQYAKSRLTVTQQTEPNSGSILLAGEYTRARRGAAIEQILNRRPRRIATETVSELLAGLLQKSPTVAKPTGPILAKGKTPTAPFPAAHANQPRKPTRLRCLQTAPFSSFAAAQNWLRDTGFAPENIISKDASYPADYQVYFPAAKTQEQARLDKMMLNAKGLTDIWPIAPGDPRSGYSLGVFKSKQRAEVFQTELAQRGVKADIKARLKSKTEWLARIKIDADKALPAKLAAQTLTVCKDN
ncbi:MULTISPECIES: hypothetical protein [Methylomonas]|uniref:hypothetical protein n=1 Tax=Methylomonas TaxID=416 RepID=UPI00123268CA|nr:hypothetical protein [Methylomonas rhizoryzae]